LKNSLFLFIFFFLISCSNDKNRTIPYSTVSIDKEQNSVDSVSITAQQEKEENSKDTLEEELDKFTILFGPGLYLTGGYLPIIRKIESNKDRILTLTGHGLGAYFATMVAFGYKADYIEWNYYKFLENVKSLRPFKSQWREQFKKTLLKDLKGKQVEQAQIGLLLPMYSVSEKKVKWIEKGSIEKVLMANIEFESHRSKLIAAFPWEFISPFLFRNRGESKFLAILSVYETPKFKRPDGFLTGLYTKAVSNFLKTEDLFEKVFKLPINQFEIDRPSKSISENRALIEYADEVSSHLVEEEEEETDE
jgi:citrate lyase gamma subunit